MSAMPQRSHLIGSESCRVVGWLKEGLTQVEIADATGVSQSVLSRIENRFSETENAGRRLGAQ